MRQGSFLVESVEMGQKLGGTRGHSWKAESLQRNQNDMRVNADSDPFIDAS